MFNSYKKYLKWGFSTFGIAVLYIIGMLFFRETHPFSRFPMYSSFPNWAYSFYITDSNGEIIPFSNLETNGGSIGHLYGSVADELDIRYGNFTESKQELEEIGDRMMFIMLNSKELKFKQINLYRKSFHYKNDSIVQTTDLMTSYGIR